MIETTTEPIIHKDIVVPHNICVQATPDCALLFIVALVSGAPDADR